MNKLITSMLILSLFLFNSCNHSETSTEIQSNTPPKPTDFEKQPEYKLGPKSVNNDTDGDGVCDYIDFWPKNQSKSLPSIFTETEFNNNISVANQLDGTSPFIISGTLAEGNNYYMDVDYYQLNLKKGERVSLVLYKGTIDSNKLILERTSPWTPKVSLLTSNGRVLPVISKKSLISYITSFQAPEDGTYYIEVSSPDITTTDYKYPYVLFVFDDEDFDGIPDTVENTLGLKTDSEDSDKDTVPDYDELYEFAYELGEIPFNCSQNKVFPINYWDRDNDGIPNWYDVDSDADGPPDRLEGTSDSDLDFIPNFVDIDSNGNNIKDTNEVGISFQKPLDSDNDGIPDFEDLDIDNDGIPNSLDPKPKKPQEPNDVGSNDSLILYSAYTKIENKTLLGIGVTGHDLVLDAKNLTKKVSVIFPTAAGTVAITPISINEDEGLVTVKVPSSVSCGKITVYIYDPETGRISNGIGLRVINPKKDILITSIDSPLKAGEVGTIKGINLSKGNVFIIFTNGMKTVQTQGVSDGNKVQFTVPQDAVSGYVKVQIGMKESNLLPVKVVRKVNVQVSPGFNLDLSKLKISSNLEEVSLDSENKTTLNVESGKISFIDAMIEEDFDKDGSTDYALVYEGIVLPGQNSIILNAQSTAVKWIFYTTGLYKSLPPSKWQEAIDFISNLDETKKLAQRIDQVLKRDPQAISQWKDDQIKELFKEAVKAVLTGFSTKAVQPQIEPSNEQYGISLSPKDPANLTLSNDTKLYLSVEAVAKDGTVIRKHISSPWDNKIVEPQGWGLLFLASDTDIKVNGRDSTIYVITPGALSPEADNKKVYGYVHFRTVFDGIVAPIISDFIMEPLFGLDPNAKELASLFLEYLGPKAISSYISEVVNSSSPLSAVVKMHFIAPIKITIKSCTEIPPGSACQKLISIAAHKFGLTPQDLARRATSEMAKKVLAKFVPVVGQLEIVLDVAGKVNSALGVYVTWRDLHSTAQQVNFKVNFPLEITKVRPACVNKNTITDYFSITVHGKGFAPYVKGHMWWKEEVYPEVFINGIKGKVIYVSNDGTILGARFPADKFNDGDYSVKIKHQGQEASSDDKIKITGDKTIYISKIEPNSGVSGNRVTIYGCGFMPTVKDTKVFFTSKNGFTEATIVHINASRIDVIVPQDAETGPVYVESNGIKSNTLNFKVEKVTFQIIFGDCGSANDDTFALYIDDTLIYSMPSPSRPFPVDVELSPGIHEVTLVGITAPDNIGTYCINFPQNVSVLSGPPLEGNDLTAGVVKKWLIKVESNNNYNRFYSTTINRTNPKLTE